MRVAIARVEMTFPHAIFRPLSDKIDVTRRTLHKKKNTHAKRSKDANREKYLLFDKIVKPKRYIPQTSPRFLKKGSLPQTNDKSFIDPINISLGDRNERQIIATIIKKHKTKTKLPLNSIRDDLRGKSRNNLGQISCGMDDYTLACI